MQSRVSDRMLKYSSTETDESNSKRKKLEPFIDFSSFTNPTSICKKIKTSESVDKMSNVKIEPSAEETHSSLELSPLPDLNAHEDSQSEDVLECKETPVAADYSIRDFGKPLEMSHWQNDLQNFSIYDYLVDMITLRKDDSRASDELIPVKVSHVNDPSSFFVKINDDLMTAIYNDLQSKLEQCREQFPPRPGKTVFEVGDVALAPAEMEGRNTFLRCRVEKINRLPKNQQLFSYDIYCIDLGLRLVIKASLLEPLELEFLQTVKPLVLHCQLDCIPQLGDEFSPMANLDFTEFTLKRNLLMLVKQDLPDDLPDKICVNLVAHEQVVTEPFDNFFEYSTIVDKMVLNGRAYPSKSPLAKVLPISDSELLNGTKERNFSRSVIKLKECKVPRNILSLIYRFNTKQTELFSTEKTKYYQPRRPNAAIFEAVVTDVDQYGVIRARIEPQPDRQGRIPRHPINIVCEKIHEATNHNVVPLPPYRRSLSPNGEAGTALYSVDKSWNRVSIDKIDESRPGHYKVHYIDYGQEESLPAEHISSAVFCPGIPALANEFRLYEVRFAESQEERFKQVEKLLWIIDRKCTFTWENAYNDPCYVNIDVDIDSGVPLNINRWLIDSEIACYAPELNMIPVKVTKLKQLLKECEFGQQFELPHRHPEMFFRLQSPILYCNNYLFIQNRSTPQPSNEYEQKVLDAESEFLEISRELNVKDTLIQDRKVIGKVFQFGDPCLARFSADEQLYRAVIISSATGTIKKVLFVDYGNSEDVHLDDIRLLPEGYRKLFPAHAYLVPIRNIRPTKSHTWPDVVHHMQEELDKYQDRLIGKFSIIKMGAAYETQVDLHVATDSDGKEPAHHVFYNLIEKGLLEFVSLPK